MLLFAILLVFEFCPQNFWQQTLLPATGSITSIVINPINGYIFAGTEFAAPGSGVFRSIDNGENRVISNSGITTTTIKALAINKKGDIFAGTSGMFKSTDNGQSWIAINSGLTTPYIRSIIINEHDHLFVGTEGGGVFKSTDDGNSWSFAGLSIFTPVTLEYDSLGYLYAANGTIYRSTNQGINWTITTTGMSGASINDFVCDTLGNIYAATYGNGVYLSADHGNNWGQVNNGLTNLNIVSLTKNKFNHIFAGCYDGGVFRTTNHGLNWTEISSGLNTTGIPVLAVNEDGVIFAGTSDGRIFKSVSSTTSIEGDKALPYEFGLEQNYPNPFNPVTVIPYSLAEASFVFLRIYDVTGRIVSVINEGYKPAGTYKILFDASDISSGVYCYSLQAGGLRITKKMVVVK